MSSRKASSSQVDGVTKHFYLSCFKAQLKMEVAAMAKELEESKQRSSQLADEVKLLECRTR